MDCIELFIDETTYYNGPAYTYFYAGIAKIDTVDFEDDGLFTGTHDAEWFYELYYPNYGFSSTQFGSIMNLDDAGDGDGDYWFDENAGLGLMHFHRFLAVHDERLDIGDTLTVWVAED